MKVEQNNIPLDYHKRYAIDQEIQKSNPLSEIVAHVRARPPGAQPASTISRSHLSALSLTKEPSFSWTSFFPPLHLNLELAFSSQSFASLERARRNFASFLSAKNGEKYKGEFAIRELFNCVEQLHSLFKIIESHRNGVKQG